jgi:hypothetical protein
MAAYCSHVDPVYAVRRSANSLDGYGEEKMFKKDKTVRDTFTFSLGGMKTITSFTAAPAITDDRFNKVPVRRESVQRPWLCFYHQAAYFPCA